MHVGEGLQLRCGGQSLTRDRSVVASEAHCPRQGEKESQVSREESKGTPSERAPSASPAESYSIPPRKSFLQLSPLWPKEMLGYQASGLSEQSTVTLSPSEHWGLGGQVGIVPASCSNFVPLEKSECVILIAQRFYSLTQRFPRFPSPRMQRTVPECSASPRVSYQGDFLNDGLIFSQPVL